ncbi:hypothetical protein DYB25_011500, partial [Aphanomyces astaci]
MVEVVDQIRDAASCLQNLLATFKRLEESNALRVTCNGSTTSGLKARVRELEAQVDERAHETARLRGQVHDLEGQIRHVVEQKDVEIAKLHARLESLDEQLKQAESDREGSDEWTRGPKTILLVKKPNEPTVAHTMREVATWLMTAKHMRVFLEPVVHAE